MEITVSRKFGSTSQEYLQVSDVDRIVRSALGEGAELEWVRTAKAGDVNSCYVLQTRKPAGCFFLKVENHARLPRFYSGQVEREVQCLRWLKEAGIPCPEMAGWDTGKREIGGNYILTQYIDAPVLSEIWKDLPPESHTEIKRQVLDVLDTLYGISGPFYGDVYEGGNRGRHASWKEAYLALAGLLLEDCRDIGAFADAEEEQVRVALEKSASRLRADFPPGLTHMDMHTGNLLVEPSEKGVALRAVLDFGNAMFGSPFTDIFRLRCFSYYGDPFYEERVPRRREIPPDDLFSCDLLYSLEWMVFAKMVNWDPGVKENLLLRCRDYLED